MPMSASICREWREVLINIYETSASPGGNSQAFPSGRSKLDRVGLLSIASATFSAILIVAFQLGLLPFFQPLFSESAVWRLIYYGFWGSALLVAALVFLTNADARRKSIPTLLVCGFSLSLLFLHPVDQVAKNYIVAVVLTACIVVTALGSAPLLLLRFSASVTALSAVICLLDVLFSDGFTSTVGRAAGLGINPNVAAAGLLLGACASFRVIPGKWRLSFLILTGSGIFVTLSRSTILIGAMIVGMTLLVQLFKNMRHRQMLWPKIPKLRRGIVVVATVALFASTAIWTNDRFATATIDSLNGLRGAIGSLEKANVPIEEATDKIVASEPPSRDEAGSAGRNKAKARIDAQIEAIGAAADEQGESNSVAARGLLFQRSLLSYRSGPASGQGLEVAHELHPHNTYLMFAVALGHAGWLVPLGFIALTFYGVGGRKHFQLGMATVALMATSHDILLVPGLLVPIALGIASYTERHQFAGSPRMASALKYVAIAGLVSFLIGFTTVVLRFDGPIATHLDARLFAPDSNFSYLAPMPRPPFAGLLRSGDFDSDGRMLLRENGILLSDRPASYKEVSTSGEGRYSMWRGHTLVFSASDNSDPRSNGRDYEIEAPFSVHPLSFLVLASLLIWCIGLFKARMRPLVVEG